MYVPVLTCPKFLDLLAEFYSEMAAPPAIDAMMVVPEAIPQPQQSLLVHDRDMTSTLARFHGEPIELRVLDCKLMGDHYRRHIVLETAHTRRPAEYGAMRVNLPLLEESCADRSAQGPGDRWEESSRPTASPSAAARGVFQDLLQRVDQRIPGIERAEVALRPLQLPFRRRRAGDGRSRRDPAAGKCPLPPGEGRGEGMSR